MSSEPKRQPAPKPRPRRRQAGAASPGQPSRAAEGAPSAAELASALGYDPDDPATWPGGEQQAVSSTAAAGEGAPSAPASDFAPLTDPVEMRALAHPVRVALIELLAVVDTLTATQASELLGESPANCAFHLRTLAKYGYVEEAGGGRGRERPWKSADRHITISTEQDDPRAAIAAGALSQLWLDRWIERARQVFSPGNVLPGWEHATGWSRSAVFLTPEESADLRGQMRRLLEQYESRKSNPGLRPPGALPMEWTVFAALVPELADFTEAQARAAAEHEDGPEPGPEA
jgi:hypothetical protein